MLLELVKYFKYIFCLVLLSLVSSCAVRMMTPSGASSESSSGGLESSSTYCSGSRLVNTPFANSGESSIDGGAQYPFTICTVAQMEAINTSTACPNGLGGTAHCLENSNVYFELKANLDYTGETHTPIGTMDGSIVSSVYALLDFFTHIDATYSENVDNVNEFNGHFNGNGYTISNWTYSDPSKSAVGFFSITGSSAVIVGINFDGISITAQDGVGVLTGISYGSAIARIGVTNTSLTAEQIVGGISGIDYNGTILDSYTSITGVTNGSFDYIEEATASYVDLGILGGIVGYLSGSTIKRCHSYPVSMADTFDDPGSGINAANPGALAGLDGNDGTLADNFWYNYSGTLDSSGNMTGIGSALLIAEFQDVLEFTNWDIEGGLSELVNIWKFESGSSYPTLNSITSYPYLVSFINDENCLPGTGSFLFNAGSGSSYDPYMITSKSQFESISSCDGGAIYFKLGANIVLDSTFTPISSFSGTFDGNKSSYSLSSGDAFKLRNFEGIATDEYSLGIFQQSSGTIQNLNLVVNDNYTPLLYSDAGVTRYAVNDSAGGDVIRMGVLVGSNSGTITSVDVTLNAGVNVIIDEDYALLGALVGLDSGTISDVNIVINGVVSCTTGGNDCDNVEVGGAVGRATGSNLSDITLTVSVTGLLGIDVGAGGSNGRIGGVAGRMWTGLTGTNNINILGSITVDHGAQLGGVVGDFGGDEETITAQVVIDGILESTANSGNLGGVVGSVWNGAISSTTLVTIAGTVRGGSQIGGVIGSSATSHDGLSGSVVIEDGGSLVLGSTFTGRIGGYGGFVAASDNVAVTVDLYNASVTMNAGSLIDASSSLGTSDIGGIIGYADTNTVIGSASDVTFTIKSDDDYGLITDNAAGLTDALDDSNDNYAVIDGSTNASDSVGWAYGDKDGTASVGNMSFLDPSPTECGVIFYNNGANPSLVDLSGVGCS